MARAQLLPADDLPLELQVALDQIAVLAGGLTGRIEASIIGPVWLATHLRRFAEVSDDTRRLIALLVDPVDLKSALIDSRPMEVLTLSAGSLFRLLRPFRARQYEGPVKIRTSQWRELRYRQVKEVHIQGIGPLGWAIGERLLNRAGRPDLADRCRIGMLRTQVSGQLSLRAASLTISQYRLRP